MEDGFFDLFGHWNSTAKVSRGRPPYEASDKDRNKVKLLLALGWSIQRIANGVGISKATLKRYFRAELKERASMRDRLNARRFEIAMEAANAGNVAALRELSRMIDVNDRMEIERELETPKDTTKPVASERLGKKIIEERLALAADADLMAELEQEAAQNARH